MRLQKRLHQYLIDLDEKYFSEYDDVELTETWINREKLEKNINRLSLTEQTQLTNADKKVFEYMEKYPNKPVYPVLENIAKIIKNSKLYGKKSFYELFILSPKNFFTFSNSLTTNSLFLFM